LEITRCFDEKPSDEELLNFFVPILELLHGEPLSDAVLSKLKTKLFNRTNVIGLESLKGDINGFNAASFFAGQKAIYFFDFRRFLKNMPWWVKSVTCFIADESNQCVVLINYEDKARWWRRAWFWFFANLATRKEGGISFSKANLAFKNFFKDIALIWFESKIRDAFMNNIDSSKFPYFCLPLPQSFFEKMPVDEYGDALPKGTTCIKAVRVSPYFAAVGLWGWGAGEDMVLMSVGVPGLGGWMDATDESEDATHSNAPENLFIKALTKEEDNTPPEERWTEKHLSWIAMRCLATRNES
jgi:hypothetical protein